MTDEPEALVGGNTNPTVLRYGDEVQRLAGPWTPAVHDVLRHLEAHGYPAPRVRGTDGVHERLTYVPGSVVHPAGWPLLLHEDDALTPVFALIRELHDALSSYDVPSDAVWHTLGADPSGSREMLCHNDLGPWNLVYSTHGEWVFIDWDLLAPGRRDWELAWALQAMIPMQPDFGLDVERVGGRFAAALLAYGVPDAEWRRVMDVVLERTAHAESSIREGAAAGEEPYCTLLVTGHADIWHRALLHAEAHHEQWLAAALQWRTDLQR